MKHITGFLIVLVSLTICMISCKKAGEEPGPTEEPGVVEKTKPPVKIKTPKATKIYQVALQKQAKQLQDAFKVDFIEKGLEVDSYILDRVNSLDKVNDPKRKAVILYEIGLAKYYKSGFQEEMEEYFLKALERAKAAGYERGEAASLAKLAMIEECKGNIDKARSQMNMAANIHQRLELMEELATDFCNLGMIEGNNDNFQKALEYLEKSLEMAKEVNYEVGIAFSTCNLSAALVKTKNEDRAEELYKAMQKYRSLTIPYFLFYRERIFSSEMPPIPTFLVKTEGYQFIKAVEKYYSFYDFNLTSYRETQEDPIIPCGFVEAPYFLE